jgi:uncharacterized coiled-coil DUF342 family protein
LDEQVDSYQAVKSENLTFAQTIHDLKKSLNDKYTEINNIKAECEGYKLSNVRSEGQIDELQQKLVFTQRQLKEMERKNENIDFLYEESLAKAADAEIKLQMSVALRVCILFHELI